MSDSSVPVPDRALIDRISAELRRKQEREDRAEPDLERMRPTLISRRADAITPERVDWLWPGRIPRGKITVIAGHPGTGKSQLACAIVATVTRGGTWPVDQTTAPKGSALILSAEDDASTTLVPRLVAAGADRSRVHVVDGLRVCSADGIRAYRCVDLSRDVAHLDEMLTQIGDVVVVVIDPMTAYMGRVDSHVNAEVRGLLGPLAQIAELHRVAIIGVTHLRKAADSEALLAVTGSLGFVAAARAVYLVAKDAADPQRRLWLPAKNNLGPDVVGLAYRLVPCEIGDGIVTSRVEWEPEPVSITANAALVARADDAPTERDAAAEWLRELLSTGPALARDVQADAKSAGYSWPTIRRAKQAVGVQVRRDGFGKGAAWRWSLPARAAGSGTMDTIDAHADAVAAQPKTMSTFAFYGEGEHLPDDAANAIDAHRDTIECEDARLFRA